MKLSIQNFRRIKHADIDIQTVTLIAGQNEQGKTSASQALAALATSNQSLLGVTKKDAAILVNSGASNALIMLTDALEENNIQMSWPDVKSQCVGIPPKASFYAAGLKRFGTTDHKEATKMMVDLLKAYPTKEETVTAISEFTTKENAEKVWGVIDRDGWDTAQKFYQEQCRNLKADWQAATGEAWGEKKAATWVPSEYFSGLFTKEELLADVIKAQDHLEKCIANKAVDMSNADALTAEAGKLDGLIAEKKAAEEVLVKTQAEYDKVVQDLSDLPSTKVPVSMPCPHCTKGIVAETVSGAIHFVKEEDVKIDESILKETRLKKASLEGGLSNLRNALDKAKGVLTTVKVNGQRALDAKRKLDSMKAAPENAVGDDVILKAREDKARADKAVSAYEAWDKATSINKRIVAGLAIADLLGAEKLRKDAVGRKIKQFNDNYLAPLSNNFGIDTVSINESMAVSYKGYGYQLLSESAKFRVDCVMQAAIAKLDGSDVVVVDGADIIIGKDRAGLLTMLHKNGIPALVTVSMQAPDKCPSLSEIGGSVYWMQDGIATRQGV